ncbi:Chromobox protein 3 [Clonorchis sinensis]|uniref:Chromobox protein 3 n=2 Tax=Clonorchis sinensis TaxID=79923 RepID=A0A8T1MCA4_CLOSI|nr:Chromobox protein 3 [Clonorchis sinensis]
MTPMESADEFDEESEYEVEELLDVRYRNGEPEYLIKWKGHPSYREMNSWEPEYNLNCPQLLSKFNSKQNRQKTTIVDIPETNEPYGFDRGLAPDCISMVTQKDGELYFLIKWKGSPVFDVVPAAQANTRCPQIVIRFYESILHFT